MNIILKLCLFALILFVPIAVVFTANDSTQVSPVPTSPQILCQKVYINDTLLTTTNQDIPIALSNCSTYYGDWTHDYFTSTLAGFPVGITAYNQSSAPSCPSNQPIISDVHYQWDQTPGSMWARIIVTCCAGSIKVRMNPVWTPAASCPQ